MTHEDHPEGLKGSRLPRRHFLGVAGAAALAAGAGTVRPWRSESSPPLSLYPLDQAAGPPDGVRLGVQRVIWSVETTEPLVALTFDDGPDDELTPRVLDILDDFGVKATFFLIGLYATHRPDLVREVVERGHELGNHTWTHPDLTRQDPEEVRRQLVWCRDSILAAVGEEPLYFRPPRGLLSGVSTRMARQLENEIVLWSVGRGVPGIGTPEAVTAYMVDASSPGDILLFHDGAGRETMRTDLEGTGYIRRRRRVEIDALPDILQGLLDKGLRPTTASELLTGQQRGLEQA